MMGDQHSALFLFTKFKSLQGRIAIQHLAAFHELGPIFSKRDSLIAQNWLYNRFTPIHFINLHTFTPQQAVLYFEPELKGNIVQLDEHVHASDVCDIVQHMEDFCPFLVYRPYELDMPIIEVPITYKDNISGM